MLSASSAASFVTSPSTPGCDYGNSSRLLSDMLVLGIGSLRVVTGKKNRASDKRFLSVAVEHGILLAPGKVEHRIPKP